MTDQRLAGRTIERNVFFQGALDTLPLIIAAIPFAILYGALAAHYQLPFAVSLGMSVLVFAGASQFIAITLIGSSAPALIIILTVFVVNLRHTLYSINLMPHMKQAGFWKRVLIGFWMTDETFAVVCQYLQKKPSHKELCGYFLGSGVFMYVNWVVFTWVGIVLGHSVPDLTTWGLDMAMVLAFTAIVIPSLKHKAHVVCVLVATCSAVLTYAWPYKTGILFSSLIAIFAGVLVERYYRINSLESVSHE